MAFSALGARCSGSTRSADRHRFRSGYARATLAVREGLSAPVPEPDPRPLLSMDDMGMGGMGGHDMASMSGGTMASMDHGAGRMQMHPASEQGNPLVDMQTIDLPTIDI